MPILWQESHDQQRCAAHYHNGQSSIAHLQGLQTQIYCAGQGEHEASETNEEQGKEETDGNNFASSACAYSGNTGKAYCRRGIMIHIRLVIAVLAFSIQLLGHYTRASISECS